MEERIAELLRSGEAAARAGRRAEARRCFRSVLALNLASVTALLWMAWLSDDPRASLAYVGRALTCDPHNPRAHAALRWARSRVTSVAPPSSPAPRRERRRRRPAKTWRRFAAAVAVLGLLIVLVGGTLISGWSLPADPSVMAALAPASSPTATAADKQHPTASPSPTYTAIPTSQPTPTTTQTSMPTETPTPTPSPTETSTPTSTATPRPLLPTASPTPRISSTRSSLSPAHSSVDGTVRWIDVDLTRQILTAYEGQTSVRTTFVSTGLPRTPTPVGRYHVYVKYLYDDMSGPGYYLSDVPYVMYFYRGYGLHGTYWHSNFGHPMSHGCINLPTSEAAWLFDWAEVGTLVNVH